MGLSTIIFPETSNFQPILRVLIYMILRDDTRSPYCTEGVSPKHQLEPIGLIEATRVVPPRLPCLDLFGVVNSPRPTERMGEGRHLRSNDF